MISSLFAILSLIIFSGCAKKEAIKSATDEEVLRERVMAYWNHRMKQELDKSYEYEDPIYKKKVSLVHYIKRLGVDPVKLIEVKIKGVRLEDATASVDLDTRIELKAPGAPGPFAVNMERKDRWGRIEGVWYHVTDEPSAQSGDQK